MDIALENGIVLRDWVSAWENADRERFVTLANDYDIWRQLYDRFPHPYTRADADEWIARNTDRTAVTNFAVCDADGPIGSVGLTLRDADYRHSAEIGYWLGQPFWGRGITTAAVKALVAYAFDSLSLTRLEAHIFARNHRSAGVLERVGFQREGLLRKASMKEGETLDNVLYAILKEDWRPELKRQ